MSHIDVDSAHKIVNARLHRHSLLFRIDAQIMPYFLSQIRQLFLPNLSGQPAHIQIDLVGAILPAQSKKHLPGNHITGHQIPQLGVFFLHKIPGLSQSIPDLLITIPFPRLSLGFRFIHLRQSACRCRLPSDTGLLFRQFRAGHLPGGLAITVDKEPSPLAPRCFANQTALSADAHGGGMVLNHLQVAKNHALGKDLGCCVTAVGRCAGGHPGENPVHPAKGQKHRSKEGQQLITIGIPDTQATANRRRCPGRPARRLQQQLHQLMVGIAANQSRRLVFSRLVNQGGHQRLARRAFGIKGTTLSLAAKGPLLQPSVYTVKGDPPSGQLLHHLGRTAGQPLHRLSVSQIHAGFYGVLQMKLGRVILSHGIDGRIDPALSQHRLGSLRGLQGNQIAANILFCQGDGCGQSRQPSTDNLYRLHATFLPISRTGSICNNTQ